MRPGDLKTMGIGAVGGALLAVIPAVAAAWAFSTEAAKTVVAPHIAEARVKVQLMCAWARAAEARDKVMVNNLHEVCIKLGGGVKCEDPPDVPPNPLLETSCELQAE